MGLKGSVRALSLDQLLEFLGAGNHLGTLKVFFKDKTCVLCLKQGFIYIDKRGQGEMRLGEILIQRNEVDSETIQKALKVQKETGQRIGDVLVEMGVSTAEKLNAAFRAQLEEELYDLFEYDDAVFEFVPEIRADFESQDLRGFPIRSILMEAARRSDEWRHIKNTIRSRKCFYTMADADDPTKSANISKALSTSAEESENIFGVERSIEETLPLLGMTQFQGLSMLAQLISAGDLVAFTPRQLETQFREVLSIDLGRALKYYECALELDEFEARQHQLDRFLFQLEEFRNGEGRSFSATMKGKRALQMLLSLFRQKICCEFYAREEDEEFRILISDSKLMWRHGATLGSKKALRTIRSKDWVAENDLDTAAQTFESKGTALEALLVGSGQLSMENWLTAKKEVMLTAIFDLVFWKLPYVQVQTQGLFEAAPAEDDFDLPLSEESLSAVLDEVRDWERYTRMIPSVRAYFELTSKGQKSITSAVDDLAFFDGRRSLEQIMRLLRKTPQDFFAWVFEQHQSGRIIALDEANYRKRLDEALAEGQIRDAVSYCNSAIDSGLKAMYFRERRDKILAKYGESTEERAPAKLEGDLASFSLAEILQGFYTSNRSGTLRIYTDRKEKEIYFENGQVYLLDIEDDGPDFLIGADFSKSMDFGKSAVAKSLVSMEELDRELAEEMKEEVYEVFLWDGARFEFIRDKLPDEFYEGGAGVTKYALNTALFLMEAVRRITEWDDIHRIVPSDDIIVAFKEQESKMRAVTEMGHQEVLLLIDGRHTISDILNISGARRFHTCQLIANLLTSEVLTKVDVSAAAEPQQEQDRSGDVERDSFPEVLRGMQQDGITGVLRVTDGRNTKELAFVQGAPHRTDSFKQGTGNPEIDAELSTTFYARDFGEVLFLNNARYQLLADVLPPVLESPDNRTGYALDMDSFLRNFIASADQWERALGIIERDKPLGWRDDDARHQAAAVPAPANVLDWIDGRRSADDIIRAHSDGRYLSFISLSELFSAGVLVYAEVVEEEEEEDWDFSL